jgi:hypothetical protein
MHDLDYVVELAKAYGNALIARDELQDELHSCSLPWSLASSSSRKTTVTKPRLILWSPPGSLFSTNASNLGLRLQTSRLSKTMMKSPLVTGTWIQATTA